ncbi:MAG: thiosulfate/3-mercaptopyruvate sulfurtransferase [Oceanospirillaceae bacterium]|jgi:thiosulfate/3-mercaptopyruvate sulfurtransferase
MTQSSPLVSAQWLNEHLNDESLFILDASIIDLQSNTSIPAIAGSLAFDYANVFCDQQSTLPNTMPSAERFTEQAQKIGLSQHNTIVVYDQKGLFYAPRAWWMFKTMGFDKVYILAGGLPKWLALGYKTQTTTPALRSKGNFTANFAQYSWVDSNCVLAAISGTASTSSSSATKPIVIDVRSAARFDAIERESRAGLRSGHIPNSVNFPFTTLVSNGELKPINELQASFSAHMPNKEHHYIFSCGSGVTACITLLAATTLGYKHLAVYDGSWTDWGSNHNLPII